MKTVELTVGPEEFPPLELPEVCTNVGLLRKHLAASLQLEGGEKLTFHEVKGGRVLSEISPLQSSVTKLYIAGPTVVSRALSVALRKLLKPPDSARTVGSARQFPKSTPTVPNSARGPQRNGIARIGALGSNRAGATDETTAVDKEAASAVLRFWFEELTTDDWFRQSHFLDDRIRQEFGALHARAAAGELAGWMSRPETCLALVVLLDQFSRHLYRGSAAAYACDGAARVASNTALQRGDDKLHWPPGPRRAALYMPFMHSEDLSDKRRAVALMREGLVRDSQAGENSQAASQAKGISSLPKLVAVGPGGKQSGGGKNASQTGPRGGAKTERAVTTKDCDDDEDSDEGDDSSDDEIGGFAAAYKSGNTGAKDGTGKGGTAGGKAAAGADAHGSSQKGHYSVQAVSELPNLPVLTLNHEHAQRFRSMRLDAQTQQAYLRDRKDVLRVMRYQCLVCAVNHEFRLNKGPGAEHQHL
eukprot:TRINITY_DN43859_c0_g1_i1.p1 TRINITY_DN43859_c0_g1~~TRINITY_DN43859_c0_g1_i1.p1  ORF type:complete len:474 (+),score=98.27 TRINITY_DN43859_c0_g1_i1:95-1516(+)